MYCVAVWFANILYIGITGASNAVFVVGLSLVSGNVGGQTKKSIASAAVFLGVATGYGFSCFKSLLGRNSLTRRVLRNIVGPFLFMDSEKPGYKTGIIGCMVSRALEVSFSSSLLSHPY